MSLAYHEIKSLWVQLKPSTELLMCLLVDADKQELKVYKNNQFIIAYPISTAKNGLGCKEGSYQTPIGFHTIAEKIGRDSPINMLFKARKETGDIAKTDNETYISQDSITSRILWLAGMEQNINLGGQVDTKQRYIYIHGTADEAHIGQAVSHGCIRMKNTDIIDLFQKVDEETIIFIS